jgi:hypothetical protein
MKRLRPYWTDKGQLMTRPVRLKFLLQERHWQTHGTFCREYDKAAARIDKSLIGTAPSRPQFHRWLSGTLTKLPHPHHCQVLEEMFPGWSANQLFEPYSPESQSGQEGSTAEPHQAGEGPLAVAPRAVAAEFTAPDPTRTTWARPPADVPAQRIPIQGGSLPLAVRNFDHAPTDDAPDSPVRDISRKLLTLQKVRRLSDDEVRLLASMSGNVIDLDLMIDIHIDQEGWGRLVHRHELLNLSDQPLSRINRELWFERTREGRLVIEAINDGTRQVSIQRIHDTPTMSTFACHLLPAVQPGEAATLQYICDGGRFVSDHYWRQTLSRHTQHFTIRLRHQDAGRLRSCTATQEQWDGSEPSTTDDLLWDQAGNDVIITLTRDYLRPNEVVTLRWDVDHATA